MQKYVLASLRLLRNDGEAAKGSGVLAGILADADRWQLPPEIDIMEQLGHEMFTVHMTYHWNNSSGQHVMDGKAYTGSADFSAGYHRFGIDCSRDC